VTSVATIVRRDTATDTDLGTAIYPTGGVGFASNSTGTFNLTSFTLASTNTAGVSTCSISYTPSVTGHHEITGTFSEESNHTGSSAMRPLRLCQD